MEKRVLLALMLCLLVMVIWVRLNPPPEVAKPGLESNPSAITPGEATGDLAQPNPDQIEPSAGGKAPQAPAAVTPQSEAAQANPATATQPVVMGSAPETFEQRYGSAGTSGRFEARFTNLGARLLELRSGDYFQSAGLDSAQREDSQNWVVLLDSAQDVHGPTGSLLVDAGLGARDLFPRPLDGELWAGTALLDDQGQPRGMEFRYSAGNGYTLTKRFEYQPGSYDFKLSLELSCASDNPRLLPPGPRQLVLRPAGVAAIEYEDSFYVQPTAVALGRGRKSDLKLESIKASGSKQAFENFAVPAPIVLAGVHVKYFAVLLRAGDQNSEARTRTATYRRMEDLSEPVGSAFRSQLVTDLNIDLELPGPGQTTSLAYTLYAGPKDHTYFTAASPYHRRVVNSDLSTFSSIGRFLTSVLLMLQKGVHNFGVAIILLTLLVRLALFPLNRRAQTAMARYQSKMKRLQPLLEAVKKKHEDDPQRLRQEQALLMQKEGAFPPLGGCLPVFLQLPIFFGLFSALRTNFELRQAPFIGWISDLSRPDRLFELGDGLPFGLTHFNLLPILMVVLWIWQQKAMPQPTDEQAKSMQRIMLFMPPVMGVFLYNYASGLSLYMITQSLLGIVELKVIKKLWPVDETEVPRDPKRGCAPFARRLAEMAEAQQAQAKTLQQRGGKSKR